MQSPWPALPFALFQDMPLRDVQPTGWVKDFLHRQAKGLSGNVEVSGYPYGYKFWGSKDDDTKGMRAVSQRLLIRAEDDLQGVRLELKRASGV